MDVPLTIDIFYWRDYMQSGRMWGSTDQDYMLSQVCERAERYANYGVPVASELVYISNKQYQTRF